MRKLVLLFVAFSLNSLSAQDFEIIRHDVKMGETVRMISRKYRVEPAEIYRLNKFAIDGIRQGMVLQVPVERKYAAVTDAESQPETQPIQEQVAENPEPGAADPQEITHTVAPKETLYSLSRMYNVPVDEIKRQNEKQLAKGLQTGQVLTIRINN